LAALLFAPQASAAPTFHLIHTFAGGSDGAYPSGPLLIDSTGTVYGVTFAGGTGTGCSSNTPPGCGVLYKLRSNAGAWKESTLYNFSTSGVDAIGAIAPLAGDGKGNFYGTFESGGDPTCQCGGVYQLSRVGGVWTQTVLHNFTGGLNGDGQNPSWGLVRDAAGNLFGDTQGGGAYNAGMLFELSPGTGGAWQYSVLYSLGACCSSPYYPTGPLALDASGNLYAASSGGGIFGYGTAFKLSKSSGSWVETTLFNFPLDFGFAPTPQGVALDAAGNLYVSSDTSGEFGLGSFYKLTPTAGYWNGTEIYSFTGNGDGGLPLGALAIDQAGALYGNSNYYGLYGYGNVFKLAQNKQGQWNLTVLYSFTNGSDGAYPRWGVVLDKLGNVYGTASAGTDGYGVAFQITP
jgi:hypothetical protein